MRKRYQQLELYSDREIKRLSTKNKELTNNQADLAQEIRALKLDKEELLKLNNSWQNELKEDMTEKEIIEEEEKLTKSLGLYYTDSNELYLDAELDGNIDLSQFHGKCRQVSISDKSKATNLTFSNYTLPFTIINFSDKNILNIDLNWIFNNRDVPVLLPFF